MVVIVFTKTYKLKRKLPKESCLMKKLLLVSVLFVFTSCNAMNLSFLDASTYVEALVCLAKECRGPLCDRPLNKSQARSLLICYFSHHEKKLLEKHFISKDDIPPATTEIINSLSEKFNHDFCYKNEMLLLRIYGKSPRMMLNDRAYTMSHAEIAINKYFGYELPSQKFQISDKQAVIILGVLAAVTVTVVGGISYCIYKWVKNRKAQQRGNQ